MSQRETADTIEFTKEFVTRFIEDEVLKGQGEVEGDTPLIEWGILDSLSVARLGGRLEKEFGVVILGDTSLGEKFRTVDAICAFVTEMRSAR
ncbi:acyl carrier protein [Streptomyces sp. NPDC059917]|uniref:acyl carrier protein n=1 Tax=Streptomyces sp. NPDC059917 TaxID=3347002 RepID=UPI00364D117A